MKEYNVTVIGQGVTGVNMSAVINTKAKNSYEAIHTVLYSRLDPIQNYKCDEFAIIHTVTCVELNAFNLPRILPAGS